MNLKKIIIPIMLVISTIQVDAQLILDTLPYLKNNPNIYSLIVAKNNKVIYEKFYNACNEQTLFNDQSLTKSICSLLIGIAIEKGYIRSVDEKLSVIFPELKNDTDHRKKDVTIRQVMNQASGLYHEDLMNIGGYLKLPNPSGFVLNAPMVASPGKEWHYNNAASHLLSVIITKTTGINTRLFANRYLFGPLGIADYQWSKMNDNYYDGGGLLSIKMRSQDMLKIGLLILNKGAYQHKQVVPAAWVNSILNPEITYATDWGFEHSTYGLDFYHFTYKETAITYGMGWGGQFLVIIPTMRVVIVVNENTADATAVQQSIAFTHQVFPVLFKSIPNENL